MKTIQQNEESLINTISNLTLDGLNGMGIKSGDNILTFDQLNRIYTDTCGEDLAQITSNDENLQQSFLVENNDKLLFLSNKLKQQLEEKTLEFNFKAFILSDKLNRDNLATEISMISSPKLLEKYQLSSLLDGKGVLKTKFDFEDVRVIANHIFDLELSNGTSNMGEVFKFLYALEVDSCPRNFQDEKAVTYDAYCKQQEIDAYYNDFISSKKDEIQEAINTRFKELGLNLSQETGDLKAVDVREKITNVIRTLLKKKDEDNDPMLSEEQLLRIFYEDFIKDAQKIVPSSQTLYHASLYSPPRFFDDQISDTECNNFKKRIKQSLQLSQQGEEEKLYNILLDSFHDDKKIVSKQQMDILVGILFEGKTTGSINFSAGAGKTAAFEVLHEAIKNFRKSDCEITVSAKLAYGSAKDSTDLDKTGRDIKIRQVDDNGERLFWGNSSYLDKGGKIKTPLDDSLSASLKHFLAIIEGSTKIIITDKDSNERVLGGEFESGGTIQTDLIGDVNIFDDCPIYTGYSVAADTRVRIAATDYLTQNEEEIYKKSLIENLNKAFNTLYLRDVKNKDGKKVANWSFAINEFTEKKNWKDMTLKNWENVKDNKNYKDLFNKIQENQGYSSILAQFESLLGELDKKRLPALKNNAFIKRKLLEKGLNISESTYEYIYNLGIAHEKFNSTIDVAFQKDTKADIKQALSSHLSVGEEFEGEELVDAIYRLKIPQGIVTHKAELDDKDKNIVGSNMIAIQCPYNVKEFSSKETSQKQVVNKIKGYISDLPSELQSKKHFIYKQETGDESVKGYYIYDGGSESFRFETDHKKIRLSKKEAKGDNSYKKSDVALLYCGSTQMRGTDMESLSQNKDEEKIPVYACYKKLDGESHDISYDDVSLLTLHMQMAQRIRGEGVDKGHISELTTVGYEAVMDELSKEDNDMANSMIKKSTAALKDIVHRDIKIKPFINALKNSTAFKFDEKLTIIQYVINSIVDIKRYHDELLVSIKKEEKKPHFLDKTYDEIKNQNNNKINTLLQKMGRFLQPLKPPTERLEHPITLQQLLQKLPKSVESI